MSDKKATPAPPMSPTQAATRSGGNDQAHPNAVSARFAAGTPAALTAADVLAGSRSAIFWLRPDGAIADVNAAACGSLGYTRDELLALSISELDPELAGRWGPLWSGCLAGQGRLAIRARHKTGRIIHLLAETVAVRGGEETLMCAITQDPIAAQRISTSELRQLQLAASGGRVGLYFATPETGTVLDARCYELLGLSPQDTVLDLDRWLARIHPEDRPRVDAKMARVFKQHEDRFEARYRIRHRDGHWVWLWDHSQTRERDAAGRPIRYAGSLFDITASRNAELELAYQAEHDPLTGLHNRRGIRHCLHHTHARWVRHHAPYALAIIDLDHFKQINDTFGHATGDQVLKQVAQTMLSGIRETDWLGRWGGDELALVLPDSTMPQAMATLERIRGAVRALEVQLDDDRITVTVSAGLTIAQEGDQTVDPLLTRADAALYKAKREGRDQVCVGAPSPRLGEPPSLSVIIEDAVRHAGVKPAFQPIVSLADEQLVAEEVLARIVTVDGRVLDAGSFIGVARQLHLLHRIDEVLLSAAEGRLATQQWQSRPCFAHISGDLVRRPERIVHLTETWANSVAALRQLVLIVDESQITEAADKVAHALDPLLRRGCRLAVAGFGGAQASYQFIIDLPVEFIEVDPRLAKLAGESQRAAKILRSIAKTAASLGITTIAKRVEQRSDLATLRDAGINWASGYLFGRPGPRLPSGLATGPRGSNGILISPLHGSAHGRSSPK